MIYFTRGGETKQDLIRNAFGSMPHQSIQILCNSTVLSFSPYQAIALSKHAITENEAQCAKRFQRMSTHTRYLLTSIQAQRIRPNLFISAYELLIGAASASNPYNKLSYGLMGAQVLEKLSHYHLNRIHAFTHHLSIAIDVLEHVENPVLTLKKINKKMKKNGQIFLTYPHSESFKSKILKEKWPMVAPLSHLHFFSKDSTKIMLNKAGFDVVEIGDFSFVETRRLIRNFFKLPFLILKDIIKFRFKNIFVRIIELSLNLLDLINGDQLKIIARKIKN